MVGSRRKKEKVYLPIVEAFVEEIRRLGMASKEAGDEQRKNASKFAKLFFEYMFGTRDFYKFIKNDKAQATTVYPYNMHGSLMKTYKGIKNNQAVPCVTMPNEIVEVRIKPLHNADSAIKKTSLKFDVQIKAQPKKVMSAILPWNK